MDAGDTQPVPIRAPQRGFQRLVPDAVLGLLSARVRFLTVPVAEARIDSQRDVAAGRYFAQLIDHVR